MSFMTCFFSLPLTIIRELFAFFIKTGEAVTLSNLCKSLSEWTKSLSFSFRLSEKGKSEAIWPSVPMPKKVEKFFKNSLWDVWS